MRRFVMLIASIAAVVVLSVVAVWAQVDGARKVARVHRGDRVQLQATLAGLTAQYLQFTFLSSSNAAASRAWSLRPNNPADRAALASLVRTSPLTGFGAALVTLSGEPLTAYPSAAALPAPPDAGYAALRRDLLAGQPGLSDVMFAGAGAPVVAFAVPIRHSGRVAGLLVTFADVRHWPLQGYDAGLRVGPGARSLVIDRSGRLVAATDAAMLGSSLPGLPPGIRSNRPAAITAVVNGVPTVVSYGPAGHGWTALTLQPAAAFSGTLERSRNIAVLALAALLCGAVVSLVVFHHKRQHALARLAEERLYDPLTGLAQRSAFQMRLDAAFARRRRHGRPLAVLYCDLDGFKVINDRFGHNTGDKVLKATATRICAAIRDTDMAVRLGGDEFAVVLEDTSQSEVQKIAERIRLSVAEPLSVHGQHLRPHISVGGAIVSVGDASADELLHEADLAMYTAKHGGTGCEVVLDPGFTPDASGGLTRSSELHADDCDTADPLSIEAVVSRD